MKTLVYLGCNQGDSLFRLLNFNFDKILCIDADPIAIDTLTKRFGHIKNLIIINTCLVPDKNISEVEFYFNKNRATNSILKPKCLEIEEKKIIKAFQLKAYQLLIVLVPIISLRWGRASERGEGGKESVRASVRVGEWVNV